MVFVIKRYVQRAKLAAIRLLGRKFPRKMMWRRRVGGLLQCLPFPIYPAKLENGFAAAADIFAAADFAANQVSSCCRRTGGGCGGKNPLFFAAVGNSSEFHVDSLQSSEIFQLPKVDGQQFPLS